MAAGVAGVLLTPFAQDPWLPGVVYAGGLVTAGLLGAFSTRLLLRGLALGICALAWLPAVLYFLVMLPPAGMLLAVGGGMAAWGAVRAARGLRSIPGPLA